MQLPPLAQAQISTIGINVDEAPLESLAMNTRGSVVICCKFQRKIYSSPSADSRTELGGSPSRMVRVKLSPGSITVMKNTDSCPTLTLNTASADMFGGKFAGRIKIKTPISFTTIKMA